MRDLILRLLPHAPEIDLFVAPHIPEKRLSGATSAYAQTLGEQPLAIYDATILRNGRSGMSFGDTAFAFQNSIETPQRVAYRDLIKAEATGTKFFGRKLKLTINRGQATFETTVDFSANADAADHVARFLQAAIAQSADVEFGSTESVADDAASVDDGVAVERVIDAAQSGRLTSEQVKRLIEAVTRA